MLDLILRFIRAVLASLYMLFEGIPALETLRSWFGPSGAGPRGSGFVALAAAAALLGIVAFLVFLWVFLRSPLSPRSTRTSSVPRRPLEPVKREGEPFE